MGAPKLIYKDIEKFIPYLYGEIRKANPILWKVMPDQELIDKYYSNSPLITGSSIKFKDYVDVQWDLRKKKHKSQQSDHGKVRGRVLNKEFYILSDGEIIKGHVALKKYLDKNYVYVIEKVEVDSKKYNKINLEYKRIRKERKEEWDRIKNTPEQIQFKRSSAGANVAKNTLYIMSDDMILKTHNAMSSYRKNFKVSILKKVTMSDPLYAEALKIYNEQVQEIKDLRKKYGRGAKTLYILNDGTIHSVPLKTTRTDFNVKETKFKIRCDHPDFEKYRSKYVFQTRQHVLDNRKKEAKDKANKIINKLNKKVFTLKELKSLLVKLGKKESYAGSCLAHADVELVQKAKSRHSATIYRIKAVYENVK